MHNPSSFKILRIILIFLKSSHIITFSLKPFMSSKILQRLFRWNNYHSLKYSNYIIINLNVFFNLFCSPNSITQILYNYLRITNIRKSTKCSKWKIFTNYSDLQLMYRSLIKRFKVVPNLIIDKFRLLINDNFTLLNIYNNLFQN